MGAQGEGIVVGGDGSLVVPLRADSSNDVISIGCGLPRVAPEKKWRENDALHTVWVTNGIRYHQTVLVTSLLDGGKSGTSKTVLLVNVAGENANAEYTEATAELSVEIGGRRQRLELAGGFVWCFCGTNRFVLGALEIPPTGVKQSSGEVLLFSGNMPPSKKGSLTMKIPLHQIERQSDLEALTDPVFAEEVQRAKKARTKDDRALTRVRVQFAEAPRSIVP